MTFVLLHSPLVGPSSWTGVAEVLRREGEAVVLPDFTGVLAAGAPFASRLLEVVTRSVASAAAPFVFAGHSGAGALLPSCAAAFADTARASIFVDCSLPQPGQSVVGDGPAWFVDHLRRLESGGWLPPWDRWWPPDAMAHLLPDEKLRARFAAELAPIPFAYFEEPQSRAPVPAASGYLRLSEVSDDDARQARARGWPVVELSSHHLGLLTEPEPIAAALLDLSRRIAANTGLPTNSQRPRRSGEL